MIGISKEIIIRLSDFTRVFMECKQGYNFIADYNYLLRFPDDINSKINQKKEHEKFVIYLAFGSSLSRGTRIHPRELLP